MEKDKEYDFSMVAGEFIEVYSKKPGNLTLLIQSVYNSIYRFLGLFSDMFLLRHCS
jgi:hypothetical protein